MSVSPDRSAMILSRFHAAQNLLVTRLRDLPSGAAEVRPDVDGWNVAQVGWHVALANQWYAGILIGSTPMAEPVLPGFRETQHLKVLPSRMKTSLSLEPPVTASRDAALERLHATGQQMAKAIASLSPGRGAGYCVTLPFGTLSLFELADFAAGHVTRHIAQVERTLARV